MDQLNYKYTPLKNQTEICMEQGHDLNSCVYIVLLLERSWTRV